MSNPAGTWNLSAATPMGEQRLTVELIVVGEQVSGTATHESGTFPFDGGVFRDDTVVFEMKLEVPVKATLTVRARADGDSLSGRAKAGLFFSFPITGTRA